MNSDAEEAFRELQCCMRELGDKNSQLSHALLKNEELKNQLDNASAFKDDIIKKHKTILCQLNTNYNELWNKYQCSKKDLTKCEKTNKCLDENLNELIRNYNALKCNMAEVEKTNTRLEEENCNLEKCLKEEKKNTTSLECQVVNLNKCLKENSEELQKLLRKLCESKNEIDKEKNLRRKLQVAHDELLHKNEKLTITKLQLNKNIENLKLEIEIQKRHNAELEQTICEQNTQLKNQMEVIGRCKEKIETLKQTMEQECVQSRNNVAKLAREKACVEHERDTLKKNVEEHAKELDMLKCRNEKLQAQINELDCKLSTTVTNAEEAQKSYAKKIEIVQCDKNKLECDVASKNKIITDLEEKLFESKRMLNAETETVHCLKIKLDRFRRQKQNCCTDMDDNQSISAACNKRSQLADQVNKVLNEYKLDCEKQCEDMLEDFD